MKKQKIVATFIIFTVCFLPSVFADVKDHSSNGSSSWEQEKVRRSRESSLEERSSVTQVRSDGFGTTRVRTSENTQVRADAFGTARVRTVPVRREVRRLSKKEDKKDAKDKKDEKDEKEGTGVDPDASQKH